MLAPATRGGEATTERPRFRQDLVAELVEDDGHRFYDVADPDRGTVFRFFEVEFSLACAMDGQRDAAGIVAWAKEELGLMPSLNEVRTVVSTLKDLGYLDPTAAVPAAVIEASKPAAEAVKPAAVAAAAAVPAPQAAKGSGATAAAKGATLAGPAVAARPAQPAASGDKDLASGIVVGAKGSSMPVEDVELGHAGAMAAAAAPMPKAAAIALGAPGASANVKPPKIPVEDIALGQAGAKDVSLDLADHIAVGKDDVKEAVRQSKVMTAVDVPKDLLDAIEDKPAAAPVVVKPDPVTTPVATPPTAKLEPAQPTAKGDGGGKKGKNKEKHKNSPQAQPAKAEAPKEAEPAKTPEPLKPEPAKAADKKPEPVVAKAADKKPEPVVVKAADAAKAGAKGVAKAEQKHDARKAPPAPAPAKTSRALIAVLLIVMAAAAGFLVWKYVLNKPSGDTTVGVAPVAPTPEPKAAPPPPPVPPPAVKAPTAKMTLAAPPTGKLFSVFPGKLETVVADGTEVKSGERVATLKGFKAFEGKIATAVAAQKKLQDNLIASRKLLDDAIATKAPTLDTASARYDEQQNKLGEVDAVVAELKEERTKFEVLARVDGTLKMLGTVGQDVEEQTLIGELTRPAAPLVTFSLDPENEVRFEVGVARTIMSGEKMVTCVVEASTLESLTLLCPASELTKEGTDVTFHQPNN